MSATQGLDIGGVGLVFSWVGDIIKAMEEFLRFLTESIESFKPKRLLTIALILFFVYIIFYYTYEHWISLMLIGIRIDLLEKALELEKGGIGISPELGQIHSQLLQELQGFKLAHLPSIGSIAFGVSESETIWKFLGGSLLLWIMVIYFFGVWVKLRPNKPAGNTALGAIIVSVLFGIVFSSIPTIYSVWINFWLGMLISFLFFAILAWYGRRKAKP